MNSKKDFNTELLSQNTNVNSVPKYFCLNSYGQYFVISGNHISESLFQNCTFYPTLDRLYKAVSQLTMLDLDEVIDQEVEIKYYADFGLWFNVSYGQDTEAYYGIDQDQLPIFISYF
ncbi:hypothetical protein [Photobacterium damselae]|uniref:hypothetical protein n=1 Tax=Photobacterium damselae TaxID=38293 RepID=UPI0040696DE0